MRLTKKACYEAVKSDYTLFYKPMPETWKKLFPVVTVDILENFGLHFTTKHNGKMSGMTSLSTTCKCNPICIKRIECAGRAAEMIKENPLRTDVSICGLCFSDRQQDYMGSMTEPLARNYKILNNGIIRDDWLPVLNVLYFRGESFGDFASVNAVINFANLARKNPDTIFGVWTKNISFFKTAYYMGKKAGIGYPIPLNVIVIQSSRYINRKDEKSDRADAVFTVYTREYAELHNIPITCGARACLTCLRCYKRCFDLAHNGINELLK